MKERKRGRKRFFERKKERRRLWRLGFEGRKKKERKKEGHVVLLFFDFVT